jgi:hypothetical protein
MDLAFLDISSGAVWNIKSNFQLVQFSISLQDNFIELPLTLLEPRPSCISKFQSGCILAPVSDKVELWGSTISSRFTRILVVGN